MISVYNHTVRIRSRMSNLCKSRGALYPQYASRLNVGIDLSEAHKSDTILTCAPTTITHTHTDLPRGAHAPTLARRDGFALTHTHTIQALGRGIPEIEL